MRRKPEESYKDYVKRRKAEKLRIEKHLKGRIVWVSSEPQRKKEQKGRSYKVSK